MPEKRQEKWQKLWKMVHREINMIEQQKPLGPQLTNRLLELKTEKIALLKERENQRFLRKMEKGKVKRGGKEKFFHESNQLLVEIRQTGLKLIRNHPNYRGVPEIYQTLALNERDYNDSKRLEEFARKSLRYKHFSKPQMHKSRVLLAEHLYNKKRYTGAINYYRDVIKNKNDQWLSKHLFNLGWCQYKKRKKEQAITTLHRALKSGERKKIISIEGQIQKSLALFYIQTKRVAEAIKHFKQYEKKATKYLNELLDLAMDQGSYSQALKAYTALKSTALKEDQRKAYHIALNKGLKLYRGDKKYEKFIDEVKYIKRDFKRGIYKGHQNILDESEKKISSMAGYFQEMLKKNDGQKKQYSDKAFTLFGILESIDNVNRHKYRFFVGETHFIMKNWHAATKSYLQAYKMLEKQKKTKQKVRKKYLDAALGTLAKAEEEGSKREKNTGYPMTKYTYYQYIKVFPKSDTAKKIYPRLFTLEFNAGKDKKAKNIITYYNKKIPKDREIQKSLATKLMDHHIDKREARKLNSWIGKLKDGFLQFSNKEINETVEILAQLVFSKIDKFERNATGKESKQKAYKTYKKLYQKRGYPRRIRAKSAYDLFRLSILTFRYDRARKWYRKIEKHFKEKEYKEYFKNFTSLAHETFLQQNRDYAMTLTLKIFSHYCQNDSIRPKGFKKEIKTTHERFFTYAITNQKSDIYLNSLKIINKCPISKIDIYRGVKRVALKALHQKKHRRFLKLAGHLQKIPRVHKKLIPHYKELYWFYHEREKTGVATRLFERLQKTAKDSQIQDIHLYRNYLKTARKRIEKLVPKFPKKFNEGQFQKEIGRVISGLEAFQKRTNDVLRTKNPHMVIKPLLYLTKAYETLGQKLREYRPKGLPKAIRKSFAKQMKGMADQFKAQSESHLRELKNSMERQQIYTLSNQGPYRRHTSKRKHLFSADLYGATYDIPRSLERRQTPVNKTAKTKRGGRP